MNQEQKRYNVTEKELQELINAAVTKIKGDKENDICQYIPAEQDGYIHHFTMRKMKTENPTLLASWVNKYIVDVANPKKVAPKPRAPRGSRTKRGQFLFTKMDIERLRKMVRASGEKDLLRKLTPKRDLRAIKRELIASIRHGEVDEELWHSYVETIATQQEQRLNAFEAENLAKGA
ncbi:MAG: hypothetical protein WD595_07095 [Waddliaceae bacterium]